MPRQNTSTWNDKDDNATFSSNEGDLELEELANLCLMTNINITKEAICLMTNNSIDININEKTKDMWYLDNRCSRHMMEDKSKFSFFKEKISNI
jgi:hypothetical protein